MNGHDDDEDDDDDDDDNEDDDVCICVGWYRPFIVESGNAGMLFQYMTY